MTENPQPARSTLAGRRTLVACVTLLAAGLVVFAGAPSEARPPSPTPTFGPTPPRTRPPISPPTAFTTCETLDSLPVGQVAMVGSPPTTSYSPPLLDVNAHPFIWSSGVSTSAGYAITDADAKAGGSGTEIHLNNLTLSISRGFGQVLTAMQ